MRDYTPVFDAMIQKYGVYTALVYGRVWRYCQGQRQECFRSQAGLGKDLGIGRTKVNQSLVTLVEDGWLTSTPTPGGRGRLTFKLTDRGLTCSGNEQVTQDEQVPVQEMNTTCSPKTHPPFKREVKKEVKEGATAQGSHEAIQAFRKATHRYPAKSWYDRIVDTVTDIEKWQQVCMEWVGKGWNPMNIAGMLDVYQNGWKGGNGSSEPKGYQAIREYLQEKGMTGGN